MSSSSGVDVAHSPTLILVLKAVRKTHDEAQLTQVIAAVAGADMRFAAGFAQELVTAAPRAEVREALGAVPVELDCRAEVQVYDGDGAEKGRVDLVFEDREGAFLLYVELKLGSHYGDIQLVRYRDALDAVGPGRKGLVAVTTATPQTGEEEVEDDTRWLGSVRWRTVLAGLASLEHHNPDVQDLWRAWLALLLEEGDFGPMNFDPKVVEGWARRDEAEQLLFSLLNELAQPTLSVLRKNVGSGPDDAAAAALVTKGKHQAVVVHPWKNQPNVQFRVPADGAEHRCRIQFLATNGQPFFTVEARYEHPKEEISDPRVVAAGQRLREAGFAIGNDGYGHYWARLIPASEWLYAGSGTLDRLVEIVRDAVKCLAESGIFAAIDALAPRTPAAPGPPDETVVQ